MGLGELFDTLVVFENYPLDGGVGPSAENNDGLRLVGVSGRDATHYPLGLMAIPGEELRLRFDFRGDQFDRVRWRRWRGASFGSLRRQLRRRSVRWAGSTFSALRNARRSCEAGTIPRIRSSRPPCRSCLRRRRGNSPMPLRSYSRMRRSPTASSTGVPTGLAHYLRARGVGPETVVGLCLGRSLDLIVGLLGILKAGGAYLPLDPDYPPERLAFMLADADACVLLTHGATHDVVHTITGELSTHGSKVMPIIVAVDCDAAAIAKQPATAPALPSIGIIPPM